MSKQSRPTSCLPGTDEKVHVLQERVRLQQPLAQSGDATLDDLGTGLVTHRDDQGNQHVDGQCSLLSKTFDSIAFGEAVQRHRRRVGLTVRELANRSGIHRDTIYRLERGQHYPTVSTLFELATAIGCAPCTLLAT
jgi:DNA-binding XRE family transcriptional regulator